MGGGFWKKVYRGNELKSFLQKSIRRGLTAEAMAVMDTAWAEGFSNEMLRRIPIIVVEDIGCEKLPDAVYLWSIANWLGRNDSLTVAKAFVAGLCADPNRSREGSCLSTIAGDRATKEGSTVDTTAFAKALAESNEVEASVESVKLFRGKSKYKVWKILQAEALKRDVSAVRGMMAAKVRCTAGGRPCDVENLLVAAVMITCRATVPTLVSVQQLTWPWFVMDMHTAPGKKALANVAVSRGMDPATLNDLWFWFSSAVGGRDDFKYREENVSECMRNRGFPDIASARAKWDEVKDEVEAEVKKGMK